MKRLIDGNALEKRMDEILMPGKDAAMETYIDEIVCAVIHDAPTLTLNTLRDEIYEDAVAHGLWEEDDDLSDDLLDGCYDLIHDEVSELDGAIEEWVRTGYHNHFAEELADVIIMSLSVAGKLGIDIDAAVKRKMEINKRRPWKHEGEKHEG